MFDRLKKLIGKEYPLVFHPTKDRTFLWNAALDEALYCGLGYEIDEPNERDIVYPLILRCHGIMGSRMYAVVAFEDGKDLYVEF